MQNRKSKRAPFLGYTYNEYDRIEIDPKTAPIIIEIFTLCDNGASLHDISKALNNRGFKTRDKKAFSISSISYILHNEKYTGASRDDGAVTIPAIIDNALFLRVNGKFSAGRKAIHEYALKNKLICGICETKITGESSKGRIYHYYTCTSTKRRVDCRQPPISVPKMDSIAVFMINRALCDNERKAQGFSDRQVGCSDALLKLQEELRRCEDELEHAHIEIEVNGYSQQMKAPIMELDKRKRLLESDIEQAKEQVLQQLQQSFPEESRLIDVQTPSGQQKVIDRFLASIRVYEDRYVFTYSFKPEPETISLTEVAMITEQNTEREQAQNAQKER